MTALRIRHMGTMATAGCWLAVFILAAVLWNWRSQCVALELAAETESGVHAMTAASGEPTAIVLARLKAREAALRGELWPARPTRDVRPVPADRSSAFMDLLHFRQEMESLAVAAGIVGSDAGFGFRDYAHSGPESEDRAFIHRQRDAAGHVLRLLFAAKPRCWLGLRRDAPPSMDADRATLRPEASLDLFEPPDPLVPDALTKRVSFELRFTGDTGVLRRFLNTLVAETDCAVVRQVEVSPTTPLQSAEDAPDVVQRETEFRVVVEWLEPAA